MGQTQCQHHLVLPQRDGVDDGGLDLFRHHGVVVLQKADLRAHLQADVASELQIVELFLKPLALVGQIAGCLCVLRQAGSLGLVHGLLQLVCPHIGQLLFAGQNIHAQLLEVGHVQIIHLIQHGDVLEQLHLMALQHGLDLFHIGLGLVVLHLHGVQLVALLLEEAQNALFLFLTGIKAFQLTDQAGDHVTHLAQILGGHLGERSLGEIADLFLAGRAVLQHLLAVGNVDLLGELVHHGLLLRGQVHLCLRSGGFLLDGRSLFLRCRGGVQRQGGHSGCIQIKVECIVCHKRFLSFQIPVTFFFSSVPAP